MTQEFNLNPSESGLDPFKYWVVDNFLPRSLAKDLERTFPAPDSSWYEYNNHFEKKRALDRLDKMPDLHATVLLWLNSHLFLEKLEQLTGIEGLIPDPAFRGGGLHQILPGGKLDVHADFNWHQKLKLDRRLNVLLYLNPSWGDSWNGHLELWDNNMTKCVKKIAPMLNRLVIFETTDFSLHGHPEPLNCPPTITRKSMAWYFYTNGRPEAEKTKPHSTTFKKRPQDETTPEIEHQRELRNHGRLASNIANSSHVPGSK